MENGINIILNIFLKKPAIKKVLSREQRKCSMSVAPEQKII
jgi:hypothetical protein